MPGGELPCIPPALRLSGLHARCASTAGAAGSPKRAAAAHAAPGQQHTAPAVGGRRWGEAGGSSRRMHAARWTLLREEQPRLLKSESPATDTSAHFRNHGRRQACVQVCSPPQSWSNFKNRVSRHDMPSGRTTLWAHHDARKRAAKRCQAISTRSCTCWKAGCTLRCSSSAALSTDCWST